jgi:hypothetical protein
LPEFSRKIFLKKKFPVGKIFGKILKKFKEFFYLTEEKRELFVNYCVTPSFFIRT